MHLVVDACGVRHDSAAVVIANAIRGWQRAFPRDRISVLVDADPAFEVTLDVPVHRLRGRAPWTRSVEVRRAARRLGADAMLSAVTASAFLGGCRPRAAIVHDLRHEVRPEQFSRSRRLARRVSYGWTFRRADVLVCNSRRTRDDVLARRPRLAAKATVAHLGADHASGWRADPRPAGGPYALAFGHQVNKNVGPLLDGWRRWHAGHRDWELHVCGVGTEGIEGSVHLLPRLPDDRFAAEFAGAALIVLLSDFEGFGLPALEALLLGVPVVISTDPALVEVTAGHAVTTPDLRPENVAAAIDRAAHRSPEQLGAGRRHAQQFTWARFAQQTRAALLGSIPSRGPSPADPEVSTW